MPSQQIDEPIADPSVTVDDRLDELIAIIKKDSGVTPESIAIQMNVSLRTVYRYLKRLRQSELLKTRYCRRHKKHIIESQDVLKPIRLTSLEALAIRVMSSNAERMATNKLSEPLRHALRKIIEAGDADTSGLLQAWLTQYGDIDTHVRESLPAYHQTIQMLSQAFDDRNKVQLRYWQPGSSQIEELVVHPLHVAIDKGMWYLMAFSEKHGETRLFRIALITSAKVLVESFRKPSKMDGAARFQRCLSEAASHDEPYITLRFSARVASVVKQLADVRLRIDQEMADGSLLCSLEPYGSGEMIQWILGWGVDVEVLKPDVFRRDLARVAATLLRRYSAALTS